MMSVPPGPTCIAEMTTPCFSQPRNTLRPGPGKVPNFWSSYYISVSNRDGYQWRQCIKLLVPPLPRLSWSHGRIFMLIGETRAEGREEQAEVRGFHDFSRLLVCPGSLSNLLPGVLIQRAREE